MIRAMIFDFDGLILDTETPELQSWQEVFHEHGAELSLTEWAACLGTSAAAFDAFAYLEARVGQPVDRQAVHVRRLQRHLDLVLQQDILPGVLDYIAAAQRLGLKLGIASTSDCQWVEGHLARLGLRQYFDVVRCADHVRHVKPAPDLYLAALDALGVEAGQAIALEDSPHGITAARRAGLFVVAVPNPVSCHLDLSHADLQIGSLTDLLLDELIIKLANHKDIRG